MNQAEAIRLEAEHKILNERLSTEHRAVNSYKEQSYRLEQDKRQLEFDLETRDRLLAFVAATIKENSPECYNGDFDWFLTEYEKLYLAQGIIG